MKKFIVGSMVAIFILSSTAGSVQAIDVLSPVAITAMTGSVYNVNNENVHNIFLEIGNSNALVAGDLAPIDPNDANVKAELIDNRTMVPLRFISENLGYNVGWDGATDTITITSDTKTVVFVLGSKTMTVNGTAKEMDVAPFTKNNRTLVSVRWLLEALGKTIGWNNNVVSISNQKIDEMDEYMFVQSLKRTLNNQIQGDNYINVAKRLEINDRVYSNLVKETITYDEVLEITSYFISEIGDGLGLNPSLKIEQGGLPPKVNHSNWGGLYNSAFTFSSGRMEQGKTDIDSRSKIINDIGYLSYSGYQYFFADRQPTIISILLSMENLIKKTYSDYVNKNGEFAIDLQNACGIINAEQALAKANSPRHDFYYDYVKIKQESVLSGKMNDPRTNYSTKTNMVELILEEGLSLLSKNPNYSTVTNTIFDGNGNKRTYTDFLEYMNGVIKGEANPQLVQEYYNTMYYGAYYFGYTTAPNYAEAKRIVEEYKQKYIDKEILCTSVNQLFTPVNITKEQIDALVAGLNE